MKKIDPLKVFLILFILFSPFMGCKDDEGDNPAPDPEKEAMEALVGLWAADEITKDDAPYEGYEDFVLTITADKRFQTSEDPDGIFPVGEFQFVEGSNYKKVICDGTELALALNGETLVVEFHRDDAAESTGKINGITGFYRFQLKAVK